MKTQIMSPTEVHEGLGSEAATSTPAHLPVGELVEVLRDQLAAHHRLLQLEMAKREAIIAREGKQQRARDDEDAHLKQVVAMWKQFKDWHGKRHPWLESVLVPCAKREADMMSQLVKRGEKRKDAAEKWLAEAEALREKADALENRWKRDALEDATRTAWENEAIEAMLALDSLRQKRLKAWPESEAKEKTEANEVRDGFVRRTANGMPAAAASQIVTSPPAPPPASPRAMPPPAPVASAPGGPAEASSRAGESRSRVMLTTATGATDKAAESSAPLRGGIKIKPWDPQTPYLKRIRKAGDDAYKAYLKERADYAESSAFFLDVADFFREERKDERLALRVVSNLAEMETESAALVRILAYRLQQLGRHDLAVPLFEDALEMRGEEPQSYRDLALALAMQERPEWRRAADLLWTVVKRRWDGRFTGVELIALHELNSLLKRVPDDCPKAERPDPEAMGMSEELYVNIPVDLRVTLTWDADNTDMDLWVIDPTGEVCIYSHNRTHTGGHMTNDFTGGYGPEVFTVRRALPGTYTVKVNFYGSRQQTIAGATTVQVKFQTAFGTAKTKTEATTVRLAGQKETIPVGTFVFRP